MCSRPGEVAGHVRAAAAEATALPVGTLVASGTGDNMAAALGLGLRPGPAGRLSLGTSGTVYAVSGTAPAPTPPARSPASPTRTATGCRWPARSTARSPSTGSPRCSGLDREAVDAGGDVIVLPYLDGERTPNLPHASGLLCGLRHDTDRRAAAAGRLRRRGRGLLAALDHVAADGAPVEADAPLLLIGGGAHGTAWRETLARLGGRALAIPSNDELVALGAAIQAAALLTGEPVAAAAQRLGDPGAVVQEARPADRGRVEAILATLERARPLLS